MYIKNIVCAYILHYISNFPTFSIYRNRAISLFSTFPSVLAFETFAVSFIFASFIVINLSRGNLGSIVSQISGYLFNDII